MTTPEFNFRPRSHRDDPASSRIAALEAKPSADAMAAKVYRYMKERDEPLTAWEIADAFGLPTRDPVAKRLSDMKSAGILKRGVVRKCRATGKTMAEYCLVRRESCA